MSSVLTLAHMTATVRRFAEQARSARRLPYAVLPAVVVVAVAAFQLGRLTAPGLPDRQGPPSLTLPPHASLVRWEEYPNDHEAIWYYTVPNASHDAVMSFFKEQMTRGKWYCFTSNFAHSITQNGRSFTGANGYVAAQNGALDVQINTGDQSFGAFLLQHDLDEHTLALKIAVFPTDHSGCGGD
jgi:hypothetical protein